MVRSMLFPTLDALKGWTANMQALDFHAKIAAAATAFRTPVSGDVMSLNDSGELVFGVGTDNVMPLFLFPRGDDPGTVNESTDTDLPGAWYGVTPSGNVNCLVATGGYELLSTEYVAADEDNLTPNALITSLKTGDNRGKISVGTLGTHLICGVVSRGITANMHGYAAVAFWPVMFPVYP